MENEIWRWIPGYEELYKVSNMGNVLSFKGKKYPEGKPIKPANGATDYKFFAIYKSGKQKLVRLNRIVCEAFHGAPPSNKHHANHIDGVKSNNRADNLEWVTSSQNNHHAYATGLRSSKNTTKRAIVQKSLNGVIVNHYPSMSAGAKAVGGNGVGISLACDKKLHTYKGFIWDYHIESKGENYYE